MQERSSKEQLIQDPEYQILVKSIYDGVKNSSKDGLRIDEGRFFPDDFTSPTFIIDFDTQAKQALFNIGYFGAFIEGSMTYHVREGQAVTKTGYIEGHGRGFYGLIHYTDETKEELEMGLGELEEDEVIAHPEIVEIEELRIVAKLIEDPHLHANLAHALPMLGN